MAEALVASDLIPGTAGFPTLIGASMQTGDNAAFAQIQGSDTAALFTQLPNGELDIIGLKGSIVGATLAVNATLALPDTLGASPAFVVNPDFSSGGQHVSGDVSDSDGTFGVQVVTESSSFVPDVLYLNSGYGSAAAQSSEGTLYASEDLQQVNSLTLVEGSFVAQELFPII